MFHFSSATLLLLALLATAHQYLSFALEAKIRDYKPSLSDLSVPNRENPKILLINFPGQSLVLNLLNGEPSASNYFVHLARQSTNSDPGFFYVDAPKGYGVMAVIQQLHLRRISDSHSLLQLVNNCKDYLIFEGYSGEKMESTNLICGSLEKGDRTFYPRQLHGPKFFNSPNGRIKVTFRNHYTYDGNELVAENPNPNPNPNGNDNSAENKVMLTVQIAFTAYSKNSSCEPSNSSSNSVGGNFTNSKFQCGLDKCIDHSLVCDDTINCSPDENTDFGLDERNCSQIHSSISTTTHHHDQTQRKHRINRLHHTHSHSHSHNTHSHHNPRERQHNNSNSSSSLISRTTESNSGETDFFDLDSEQDQGDDNGDGDSSKSSSKPPQMTTIIILVISLTLITICGYFWSWLSQLCCFFRSFRSFPRSATDQRISPSTISPAGFTISRPSNSPSGNISGISGNIPSNIGIAYYVPAIILNNNNNNNNNSETNSQNPDSHGNGNGGKAGEMPPSYETLFPQKE